MTRHSTAHAAPLATHATPLAAAVAASSGPPVVSTVTVAAASAAPVAAPPTVVSRATLRRRRLVALVALLVLSILLTVAIGRVGAQAELAEPVAGHAVVEPGDTLWDVAVDTAPNGVDPREQLAAIRVLNGLDGSAVAPWTVLLLPAR